MAQGVASAPALQQSFRAQGGPAEQGVSPKREPHRHTYGAIDLGTNNCRLLIARPSEGGFTVIDAFSRIVRLGEGLARSGALSDHAMDRAVGALSICADKLRRRNVSLSRSVATEACRRAKNGAEFAERVREQTGIVLDIIEPAEEARLAVLGCHKLLEPGDVYFIERLPVRPETGDFLAVAAAALALCLAAAYYPAWRASRLDPVEAIRRQA